MLEEWSLRTTGKQRISGRRLHRQLREEGYEVGLTLVLAELREWRRRRAEVYVPLVHRPAENAQVDFFAVTVDLNGERRRIWKLLVRLMYPDRDFDRLYERQDQLAFLDGHMRAFAHFSGVPQRMVYDNLSAAVRRVQFPRRQLIERFQVQASHYLFETCFARHAHERVPERFEEEQPKIRPLPLAAGTPGSLPAQGTDARRGAFRPNRGPPACRGRVPLRPAEQGWSAG